MPPSGVPAAKEVITQVGTDEGTRERLCVLAGVYPNADLTLQNFDCKLKHNKTYEEVHILPEVCEINNVFYTYEGLRCCGSCCQLLSLKHDCPSTLPEGIISSCDSCGMPYRSRASGRNKKLRHPSHCRGEAVHAGWEPDTDSTLYCPLCKTPGFNYETLDYHLTAAGRQCDGKRKLDLQNETGWESTCQGCGHTFARHIAAAMHCHEDALPNNPLGYGGGQIAGDPNRIISDAVRDASWGIPFSTYTNPTPGSAAQYLEDLESLNVLVHYRLRREATGPGDDTADDHRSFDVGEGGDGDGDYDYDYDDGDDDDVPEDDVPCVAEGHEVRAPPDPHPSYADACEQEYFGRLAAEVNAQLRDVADDQALAVKHELVRQALAREIGKRNQSVLERANISINSFRSSLCPGFSFTHGYVPCPYEATLDLDSVKLEYIFRPKRGRLAVAWPPSCFRCEARQKRLFQWQKRCKYNADGSRMCVARNCRNFLVDSTDCQEHAQARQEARLKAAQRRLNNPSGSRSSPRKRASLWEIVSPADAAQWASGLGAIRTSWDKHPIWGHVLRMIEDGPKAGKAVYVVDTETVLINVAEDQPRNPLIFELAVADAKGVVKLNTTLQHGDKTISELCKGIPEQLMAYACRIYSVSDTMQKTKGMLLGAAKKEIIALELKDSLMIEWSTNGWDWRALRHTFGDRSVPDIYLRGNDLLRMAGYRGPADLQTLFYLFFPNSPLKSTHHRALINARKLLLVLYYILTGGKTLELDMGEGK
ncbi:hypothetical protein J7T55_013093 [Diaporthe amygdali]|uniref:uncharacterized protein n=1 Tax=Phomopsis amygdali TaxID=1214568 RepID=UPI0022FEE269|nr:uncharacterized protein J7T55_013093 [Diaporthe amygdali]KAJ0118837.1 hypothetical protein J7T55_013093 [Diaporthe amygdali]